MSLMAIAIADVSMVGHLIMTVSWVMHAVVVPVLAVVREVFIDVVANITVMSQVVVLVGIAVAIVAVVVVWGIVMAIFMVVISGVVVVD